MYTRKFKRIFILSIILLLFFITINIYISYSKINRTVEESIANQSLQAAKSIASSMDVEGYKRFLANPVRSQEYWEIRRYLNDAREKIGALHVYTLAVDNPRVSKGMIMGMPEEWDNYDIGDICTVPEKQVKRAYEGKTYVTDVLTDLKYGNYLSVGAPIKDKEGDVIGYLGIDISVDVLDDIGGKILGNSIWLLIFNGLFVLIVSASFFIIQRWYHQEVAKEMKDTEDIYHSEVTSLISSAQSLRHDFFNHIQVMHGLLKLGHHETALNYITSLFKEARSIENININIENPGLSVLLQTKKFSAQNHNIDIDFDVSNHSFEAVKTVDLIKILSNLIDNAIEATLELPEDEREIGIECKVEPDQYLFKIENTGQKIQDKESIFNRGYSTKERGKQRGQGLYIVRNVIHIYGGEISIDSTENKTSIIVLIPIKN
ncbi:GHKL domain-containing protein [Bacillus suaedae]|uniref:GHKL domain-containing protein n=1 Tax=Halalkalibacter suaedae TaxID=2822140 RepID=A0A940WUQ4_9BACI|nr:GHKL domain-containing protein [Bacillus suaedae]MBP3952636.1 GHKL domain-containing protein [Bacillus suaedae]